MHSFRIKILIILLCASIFAIQANSVYASTLLITVDNMGYVGLWPSLALKKNGNPVIAYFDQTNHNLKLAVCNDNNCKNKTFATVDSGHDMGYDPALVLNSNDYPIISYYDQPNGNLKLVVCSDTTCGSKTFTTVDSIGDVGDFPSMALNRSGFPVISYPDFTSHELKLAICSDVFCNNKVITILDSGSGTGYDTSLVLNQDDFPVVSYSNGGLKVVVCADTTCTDKSTTTVDSSTIFGMSTSLKLNKLGFPVISYLRTSNNFLYLANCLNLICTNKSIKIVDGTDNYGRFTSLVLSNNDYPIISYANSTSTDLKLAVCADAQCDSSAISTVASSVYLADDISMAVRSDGSPIIGFTDYTFTNYPDGENGNLKLAIIDNQAPSISGTNLTSNYEIGPSSFKVTFGEDVRNSGGGSSPEDVTNPSNYLLVEVGADGVYTTISCKGGVVVDDVKVPIKSVTYNSSTFTSVITLSSPLETGNYRLFVCGTTSIVDMAGNPIAGDGSNKGTDFILDISVGASRLRHKTLPFTGFSPSKTSFIPAQSASSRYSNLGSVILEIPTLKIFSNVVGVPKSSAEWDVKWLTSDIGWLNGTAFPTWEGNSVITGHVYSADGLPGPFVNIKNLKYGDQIIVHMSGEKYIFEVLKLSLVNPTMTSFAYEHLEGNSFLTLITCERYDQQSHSYLYRRIVRAVLVKMIRE